MFTQPTCVHMEKHTNTLLDNEIQHPIRNQKKTLTNEKRMENYVCISSSNPIEQSNGCDFEAFISQSLKQLTKVYQ